MKIKNTVGQKFALLFLAAFLILFSTLKAQQQQTTSKSIHSGGYAAYPVYADIKDVRNNGNINGITDLNENNFNRWDFGLAGGVAFDIENFTLGEVVESIPQNSLPKDFDI